MGILGWDEGVEASKFIWAEGMTTHCVIHLIQDVPVEDKKINPLVCAHEAGGAILAYRGLDHTVGTGRMFRDTLYMHVTLRATDTSVPQGDSVRVRADTFYSGGFGGGSGGPAVTGPPQGHIDVAKPTNGAVTWYSRQPSALAHLGQGWFKGVLAGSAGYVGARPSGPPSAETRWWLPFEERGDSLLLSVTAAPPPPPPPPFVVTSDQTPITTPGDHLFTAHIGSSTSTIEWFVDDSRTIPAWPYGPADTTFANVGQTVTLSVESGSYTLHFGVRVAGETLWQRQDIPDCTAEALTGEGKTARSKSSGASTNAVEGCPPP